MKVKYAWIQLCHLLAWEGLLTFRTCVLYKQVTAGAVLLTDVVFWLVLYPFEFSKEHKLSFVSAGFATITFISYWYAIMFQLLCSEYWSTVITYVWLLNCVYAFLGMYILETYGFLVSNLPWCTCIRPVSGSWMVLDNWVWFLHNTSFVHLLLRHLHLPQVSCINQCFVQHDFTLGYFISDQELYRLHFSMKWTSVTPGLTWGVDALFKSE